MRAPSGSTKGARSCRLLAVLGVVVATFIPARASADDATANAGDAGLPQAASEATAGRAASSAAPPPDAPESASPTTPAPSPTTPAVADTDASRPATTADAHDGSSTPRTAIPLALPPPSASAKPPTPPPEKPRRYFYKGYDYGSQSLYGPLYVILNRGFDVLQMRGSERQLGQNFQLDTRNVFDNLTNPGPAIQHTGGWWRFIRQEILPLSFTPKSGRWVPNYTLHLIGGGQTYAQLREWFMDHEAPAAAATIFSAATVFASAVVNESIENKGVVGYNTDAIADILVFDIAGVVLFSFEGVRDLFSHYVKVSDWSMQPALTLPTGNLHNQGNYYAAKVQVPYVPRLKLLGYGGMATMGGLSYELTGGYSVSAAVGGKFSVLKNIGVGYVENEVVTKFAGALFIDRNDSLLASLQMADVPDYFVNLNVYPNALFHSDPGFGFWGVLAKDGRFVGGISFTRAFGLGVGAGSM